MKKFAYLMLALALLAGCKGRSKTAQEGEVLEETVIETIEPKDTAAVAKAARDLPEEPIFDIVTSKGTIRVKLYKDTPRHRDNFKKLALSGYYDGLLFHRVINGFMIQGGDPFTRDTAKVDLYGQGGPSYTIPAEMRDESGVPLHRHKKGALAAARRGDVANPFKESSGSQFYIVQNPDACLHLDGPDCRRENRSPGPPLAGCPHHFHPSQQGAERKGGRINFLCPRNCSHPRLHKREGPTACGGRGREATFRGHRKFILSHQSFWHGIGSIERRIVFLIG